MHIGLIGSARFGTAEPHAGGLEAHVATLAEALSARGHDVQVLPRTRSAFSSSDVAARDVSSGPAVALAEHHAYLLALLALHESDIEILHNHSLHYLPVAMARALRQPMLTTLHSPPTPWMESAFAIAGAPSGPVVSVSAANARQWRATIGRCGVVANGIDLVRFRAGPGGGGYAAWTGRIVPEKGVLSAIAAARAAGMPLRIAGPVHDVEHFEQEIVPRLGYDVVYVGHLDSEGLNELVGHAEVTLVTPHWEEPYGLVVAESLAMGTPVAAFGRGGIPEILTPATGVVVPADDMVGLATAVRTAAALDRPTCRKRAEDCCDVERMVDRYEELYRRILEDPAWRR